MNDLERRLLDSADSDEKREQIRKILDHERRVAHARSFELFLQGLGGVSASLHNENRELRRNRKADAGLLLIKLVAAAVLVVVSVIAVSGVVQ